MKNIPTQLDTDEIEKVMLWLKTQPLRMQILYSNIIDNIDDVIIFLNKIKHSSTEQIRWIGEAIDEEVKRKTP